jgi:DNA invertase Pin-like site-specific DNA recombinase
MNGIYVRVSKGTGQDIASQKPDLDRWAAAQSEESKVYPDERTGKTMDRPGFSRLMDDCRAGKIKTVVVWRLDRLGRTAKGLTALFEDLRAMKVNLISLKDGLDLATPAGRMMANVLASVAQYETEVRAERIHAGLEVAKANGVKLGRKPLAEGERAKRIKVTPEQEAIVSRLKSEGKGVSAIAKTTGLSRPTVYGIIQTADRQPAQA